MWDRRLLLLPASWGDCLGWLPFAYYGLGCFLPASSPLPCASGVWLLLPWVRVRWTWVKPRDWRHQLPILALPPSHGKRRSQQAGRRAARMSSPPRPAPPDV